ncbi:hypothetical protein ARAM_005958 [Aspergillus rambellii]|uniref:MHYT domain-containing protein n=1 Tax=Aspergillus rambellii TaxID=308745 RepID=A0A0F8V1H4_9EURO|nr:hypothetical protein ARAM_005958 [Aspergillus rambellii]
MSTIDSVTGEHARVSYLGGYIFLSYVVSVMGCTTTLELLHRRTSTAGLYNWYLLLTSSITMGGIGIWCMHFIGNRAIVLGDGDPHVQVIYSMSFTGVSFILPVCVLLAAFYAAGTSEKAGYARILTGGLLTGGSVCGMHYVGQLGINNYICSYRAANVAGSAVIAVFASTAALSVFFRWRASWTSSWWRRGVCGCGLAVAVSGMHWTAAAGTSYMNHNQSLKNGGQLSRSQTVIICSVLACVACGILSACAIAAGGNHRRLKTQAQQLVLSSVFFDPEAVLWLPLMLFFLQRKLSTVMLASDDDLTRTHPAFLWAFRASRNWKLIKEVVPSMRDRIEVENASDEYYLSKELTSDREAELHTSFDELFKRHFCVAAQDLADDVRQPLEDLGMLYDDVLTTSTTASRFSRAMGYSRLRAGRGQLMFTVRQLNKQDASRLAASGFRFTAIENVATLLSRRMNVASTPLGTHLRDMRDFATSHRNFESGVHLVSFVLRPTVHDHFEVLTAKGASNPLPSITLPTERLRVPHLEVLSHMEGWSISTCLDWLKSKNARKFQDVSEFREQLIKAMSLLAASLPPDVNSASRFAPRPLIAPCRSTRISDNKNCFLLAFCTVGSLDTRVLNPDYIFTPLRLFRVQQQMNGGVPDADGLAKELSQGLLYSNVRSSSNTDSDAAPSVRPPRSKFWPSSRKHSKRNRSMSQETLTDSSPLGDIVVRREVKVDVAKISEPTVESAMGRQASVTTVVAGDISAQTYVDELYNLCYAPGIRLRPDTNFCHTTLSNV